MSPHTYLDYAASTPVDPRVLEVMLPYFSDIFGNPSSVHTFGQQSEAAVEMAREQVAGCLHCIPSEIVFTSCGSESDNLALRGAALAARQQRGANIILTTPVEHPAVSKTARQLAQIFGFKLEFLPVDEYGRVSPADVAARLTPEVAIVSIIYANNEIGTINPIREIGALCRQKHISFHTDAVQAAAYLSVNVEDLQVDLLSIGAHKFYGPKGVGAIYIRAGTPILPVQTGGSQESGLRAGTHNVPLIVGLGEALQLAHEERTSRTDHLLPLRDHLIGQVLEAVPGSRLTGHPIQRLPNHASFAFQGIDGNKLLMLLDLAGYACSSGSACKTGSPEPSDVLLALGLAPDWALGSLRVTLGKDSTSADIQTLLQSLPNLVQNAHK